MGLPIKPMSLGSANKIVKETDIAENFESYQKAISYYRWYPDKLIDLFVEASGPDCTFKLYDFQRVFLRALARHSESYLVFSRGTSKSFTNILYQSCKCISYPGTKGTVVASTKGQSADILWAKLEEVYNMIPAMKFELLKKTKQKDNILVEFKNGSTLVNTASKESSRGLRFNSLTTEEIITTDPDKMDQVVRPTLAISRLAANGRRDPNEITKRQEIVVTTAGYKGTYAYDRLIATLIQMMVNPKSGGIVLGGSYRIPVISGLQSKDWVQNLRLTTGFNPVSFPREFLSKWASGTESAYFPADTFDKLRSLKEPVFEREGNLSAGVDYYMSIDVGRYSDTSEIVIGKRIPHTGAASTKHIVNIVTLSEMGFPEQALRIKQQYEKYQPKAVVIDGAGVGAGLIDELVLSQLDPETGFYHRPWGVINDPDGRYNQFKAADTIKEVLYIVKANAPYNTQMYGNLQQQFLTNKLRFLVNERDVRLRIEASRAKKFTEMTEDDKIDYLLPFYQTTELKNQMINLESTNEGLNIIMKRSNSRIKKDKVSALGYLLYYIKTEIDDKELSRKALGLDEMFKIANNSTNKKKKTPKMTFSGNRNYKSKLKKKR